MTADWIFLIRAAREGNHSAFTKLMQRTTDHVQFVISRRVDKQDVDDLVQETYLDAWNAIGNLRDPLTFRGWLVRLAFGCVNRRAKRQQYEREALAKLAVSEVADPAPESGWSDETQHALDALDPQTREVVVLRHCDNLSMKEIAKTLGLTPATVRKRVALANRELARRLEPTEDRHEP